MQPTQQHSDYYRNRAAQERSAADRSTDPTIRRIHLEMAEHYESFLSPPQPAA